MRNYRFPFFLIFCLGLIYSCNTNGTSNHPVKDTPPPKLADIPIPDFQADSAYAYIEKQLSFGPRVPNSSGHLACANWLEQELRATGGTIFLQPAEVQAYTGTRLYMQNIIASFQPEKKSRIILSAHWDTRHIAEVDPDSSRQSEPILGANDGGSGVAILLEIARLLGLQAPDVGVDIMLWDAEDYGDHSGNSQNSYCLGSQHWAKNPHKPGYKAKYGINLDMVGAHGATFYQEGQSRTYASDIVKKVWDTANRIGYGSYFPYLQSDGIVDDHLYINAIARIPMIDIIHQPNGEGFFEHWHTHQDDIDAISKETLKAVGQTMLEVIYREK